MSIRRQVPLLQLDARNTASYFATIAAFRVSDENLSPATPCSPTLTLP